ncbi:MAG: carbamoyl-phosphate synthase large subunit, partial [Ruminococcaceae bacterium]|nr:carbamoyl-phosphate synthase large subunit [Oscillospiraceae bacterium]
MKRTDVKKVIIIGSGPIIIGQAAEFDYAGTQACRALREEGIEVILINSNPATIMTDKQIADKVYIEPLTVETIKKVILKENPDSILPTLGGQNALNLAVELEESGFLKENNVEMIGTNADTIRMAEDRELFKEAMERIQQPCAQSAVAENIEDCVKIARKIGYPVVVRPAYTLGGSGGGIAADEEQLLSIATLGLHRSRVNQVLIERCISGWKEIEYEVMRDRNGNCITVCNMENFDPVGVHTGDSIVVAPCQTLADKETQMLRSAALAIIRELKVEGGCNVQFALNPKSFEYCVIEVNPRVSRSSALASKATGYPIAKVASKIALGYTLDEIQNAITKKTFACFEPTLDYCVVKIPRWPFDKFVYAKRSLGTQMKATGEVMGIAPTFEAALMKSIRSLEQNVFSLLDPNVRSLTNSELEQQLYVVDDRRLWVVSEALRRGVSPEKIHDITKIDLWFLDKLLSIIEVEKAFATRPIDKALLLKAKDFGFLDKTLSQ